MSDVRTTIAMRKDMSLGIDDACTISRIIDVL